MEVSFYEEQYASPATGSVGKPIQARVNYFELKPPSNNEIHVYAFKFQDTAEKEVKNAGVKKQLIHTVMQQAQLARHANLLATDHHSIMISMVNRKEIEGQSHVPDAPWSVSLPVAIKQTGETSKKSFRVVVNYAHTCKLDDLRDFVGSKRNSDISQWLTVLNILSKKLATKLQPAPTTVNVGGFKLFPLTKAAPEWPNGLHARNGYYSSVRPVGGKLVLNMHNVSSAFITPQPLIDYVKAQCPNFRPGEMTLTERERTDRLFNAITRRLKVRLMYQPVTKESPLLSRILRDPPNQGKLKTIIGCGLSTKTQRFKHEKLGEISVHDYFTDHVLAPGTALHHSDLLVCNVGSPDRPMYIPAELLYVEPDQHFPGPLPEASMAAMVQIAQHKPLVNVARTEAAFIPGGMFDAAKVQEVSGLRINPKMMHVKARVIEIPDLVYKKSKQAGCVKDGSLRSGRWDLRGKVFMAAGKLPALGVIEIGDARGDPKAYASLFASLGKMGIDTKASSKVAVAEAGSVASSELKSAWDELKKINPDVTAVLVILPTDKEDPYAMLKTSLDTEAGIPNVCVTKKNVSKLADAQFQANLALKFNVKTGGRNHTLPKEKLARLHTGGDTIIFGADVTHPSPGSVRHCPSIAAVVATTDKDPTVYVGEPRLQTSKQEEIEDLADMVFERLGAWYAKNQRTLPANVLFYRDGVSESQFAMVQRSELPKIQAGCSRAGKQTGKPEYASYVPQITLVVCGKRHHTRFFPAEKVTMDATWAIDSNKNFKPGVVVDDPSIRSPYHFDFFLQSHSALKGTARPCHYFVITNTMNLSADTLQSITNDLCWIYAVAVTPISYAAPAYYADRLCSRGRCYLRPLLHMHHPKRPTDAQILGLLRDLASARPTEGEKDRHVCAKFAMGVGGFWKRVGERVRETMFFV